MVRRVIAALAGIALFAGPELARAEDRTTGVPAELGSGAVEIGVGGAVVTVEGSTRADVTTRAGFFFSSGLGLAGPEIELTYSHVGDLDALDLVGNLSWTPTSAGKPAHPFVSLSAGVRQEWLGSFRQARFPLGAGVGVRHMIGSRVALRADYRVWRVLDDPVSDFNEQRLLLGISLFLRNGSSPPGEPQRAAVPGGSPSGREL